MYDSGNLEDETAVGFILNAFDLYFIFRFIVLLSARSEVAWMTFYRINRSFRSAISNFFLTRENLVISRQSPSGFIFLNRQLFCDNFVVAAS